MMSKNIHRNILIMLLMVLPFLGMGQENVQYLELGSSHALYVPENPDYHFFWTKKNTTSTDPIETLATDSQYENVTVDIYWGKVGIYEVTVQPQDATTFCYGEPIKMTIIVVPYLTLHAMDDAYTTTKNTSVKGDLSVNDFDTRGNNLVYPSVLNQEPKNGTVKIMPDGTFTYTPNDDFVGVDQFVYDVLAQDPIKNTTQMRASAVVRIVVGPTGGVADILVEKKGPKKALFEEVITYNLVVRNLGPDSAKNVLVRDTLAFGLLDYTATYSVNNTNSQPWKGEVYLKEDLAAGDSAVVAISVTISKNSPQFIWNQALVYSDNTDPNVLNNDSIWMTEVSNIYVDASDLIVPSCQTAILYGDNSNSINPVTSYRWEPALYLDNPNKANPKFTPGATTKYKLTITDSNGNKAVDSITVTVPIAPQIKMEGDTYTFFMNKNKPFKLDASGSVGDSLSFTWTTDDGKVAYPTMPKVWNKDTLSVAQPGEYHLRIVDDYGCFQKDTIYVLYESHPPVVVADILFVTAQSATDSPKDSINVLANDSDNNDFDLRLTDVSPSATFASKATFTYSEDGFIVVTPRMQYNVWDSLQYTVCNNGIPEQCSTGWLHVYFERPPLNADVVVQKSVTTPYKTAQGMPISFLNDTIQYELSIYSLGPDTATVVTLTDPLDFYLTDPRYSIDGGNSWTSWNKQNGPLTVTFNEPLLPNTPGFQVLIRAFVNQNADSLVTNKAWIQHNIVENNIANDTATVISKMKQKVEAIAGDDLFVGACQLEVPLDGSKSTGEGLTYRWTPSTFLDDPNSATPIFKPGNTTTYILTVTDNDGITDTDTLVVQVLPEPIANAGPDLYLKENEPGELISQSTGSELTYEWSTKNGEFFGDNFYNETTLVIGLGEYQLKVTDQAGCSDSTTVHVYRYYHNPFAVDDYFSTTVGTKITDKNVLANDSDPNNAGFTLTVIPVLDALTKEGGRITINSDGTFVYTTPNKNTFDEFYYTVCNNAEPPRCSQALITITVNNKLQQADLNIKKIVDRKEQFIGSQIEYTLQITNNGPDAAVRPLIRDSLSQYLRDARYVINNRNAQKNPWPATGNYQYSGNIAPGVTMNIYITATIRANAPDRIFNTASVASITFDHKTEWDSIDSRNADTVSFRVVSDLAAIAKLYENYGLTTDATIAGCVNPNNYARLDGTGSLPNDGSITSYQWGPPELVDNPNSAITNIVPNGERWGKTNFTLRVQKLTDDGVLTSFTVIPVNIEQPPKVDIGTDRKLNPGVDLVIDASKSYPKPANAVQYEWTSTGTPLKIVNPEKPIATGSGVYTLMIKDQYGCFDEASIKISENDLVVVDDVALIIKGNTFYGNVATNDYDPDGDSLLYTGWVNGPQHGMLIPISPAEPRHGKSIPGDRYISNNGSYTYSPNLGFTGYDSFEYQVCDNNDPSLCKTGRVFIRVIDFDSINNPPVAVRDVFFMMQNDTITSNLMNNDFDYDGGIIQMETTPVVWPTQGTLTLNANGTFRYISNSTATGSDRFVYRICDNGKPNSECDTASVFIYFHKFVDVNHPPVANDDAFYFVGGTITGNVLLNDYDPDGDKLSLDVNPIKGPSHGKFVLDAKGDFTYVPNENFFGTDQIVYRISDVNLKSQSSYATVYILSIDEKELYSDVSVSKSAPAKILSGEQIQYELTVAVNGPSLANNIKLTDPMLDALTNKQYSIDNGATWKAWAGSVAFPQTLLYGTVNVLLRGDIPAVFSDTIVNLASVTHNMQETRPNNNQASVQTIVYQRVIARLPSDTLIGACNTDFQLDATKSLGMSTLKYSWTPATALNTPNAGKTSIKKVEPGSSTKYTVIVSSTHEGFTSADTASIWVNVAETVVANAGPDIFPDTEGPVTLTGSRSSGREPLTYVWWMYDSKQNVVVIDSTQNVTVARSGEYHLTVIDPLGCEDIDEMYLLYPVDEFVAVDDVVETWQEQAVDVRVLDNDIIDEDDDYDFTTVFINKQPAHGTVYWKDSVIVYTPAQYYFGPDTFCYSIGTQYNLAREACVTVNVKRILPEIPGGFSPNGDGINDYLIIPDIELYPENNLIVFNRWGSVVYKTDRYSNEQPWDGVATMGIRLGRKPLPAGGYLYILDLGDNQYIPAKDRYRRGVLYIASGK
jgi:gliding motility-associated-like protein/uncharacterized repeat protein (TIGR01451 family)